MRIGVMLTADNACEPEITGWCPPEVDLHYTRIHNVDWGNDYDDTVSSIKVAEPEVIVPATRTLTDISPEVIPYFCTSGSFVRGLDGERELRDTMVESGAKRALTTSGALLDALEVLGLRRIAVGAPYDQGCSELLADFLTAAGHEVASLVFAPPVNPEDYADYPEEDIHQLAERAHTPDADAMFLSCTALRTKGLIAGLTEKYGMPVLTSTQVTMWATLAAAGAAPEIDQELFRHQLPASSHVSGEAPVGLRLAAEQPAL